MSVLLMLMMALVFLVAHAIMERKRAPRRVVERLVFSTPSLGFTMADGGQPVEQKTKEVAR